MNSRDMIFLNLYNFINILIEQPNLKGQEELIVLYIKYMRVYVHIMNLYNSLHKKWVW